MYASASFHVAYLKCAVFTSKKFATSNNFQFKRCALFAFNPLFQLMSCVFQPSLLFLSSVGNDQITPVLQHGVCSASNDWMICKDADWC